MTAPPSLHMILSAVLCIVLAPTARADVIVVDPAGGGDHTTLNAAVLAAAEGDTLLIRVTEPPSGQMEGAAVTGKSLTIVADAPDPTWTTKCISGLAIRDLAAGQRVVLRRLWIGNHASGAFGPSLDVTNCAGAVWVEDCRLVGGDSTGWATFCFMPQPGGSGLRAMNSASVTVVRSSLTGGKGGDGKPTIGTTSYTTTPGGPGALLIQSSVAFQECTLQGGPGGSPQGGGCEISAGDGGDGLHASIASALLSGCSVTGGAPGSTGGPGSGVWGNELSSFHLLDTAVAGGPGGAAYFTAPGTVTDFVGTARSFALDSPLREGESGTLSMQGVQGDFVGFFWSFGAGSLPMPARNGWFVLDPAQLGGPFFIGTITDPGGVWDLPITAPSLLPALEAQTFLLQAWFQYPGGVTLGSGTSLTLVDQGL